MTDHDDSHDAIPADDAGRPETEHGMTRRQLMRHAGWFGGAVVLTVAGGEVISHIADSRETNAGAAVGAAVGDTAARGRARGGGTGADTPTGGPRPA
ncbi:hypothetical protein ACFW2E_35045, partial [Streptomyces sp. NPDC058964]